MSLPCGCGDDGLKGMEAGLGTHAPGSFRIKACRAPCVTSGVGTDLDSDVDNDANRWKLTRIKWCYLRLRSCVIHSPAITGIIVKLLSLPMTRTLRPGAVKRLAQDGAARKWLRQNLNQEPVPLTTLSLLHPVSEGPCNRPKFSCQFQSGASLPDRAVGAQC